MNGSGDWIDGEADELTDSLGPVLFPCVDSRCPTWTGARDLETEMRARDSERGGLNVVSCSERNSSCVFLRPPLSRVARLAQGGEVDGRRLFKRANFRRFAVSPPIAALVRLSVCVSVTPQRRDPLDLRKMHDRSSARSARRHGAESARISELANQRISESANRRISESANQ